MIRTSNPAFLYITAAQLRENIGWWIEIFDYANPLQRLARVYRFREAAFSIPMSDVGAGTAVLYRDDPVWDQLPPGYDRSYLFDRPNTWRFYEDGVERFRMIHESHKYMTVSTTGDQVVEVAGPGWGQMLGYGIVLPPQYPTEVLSQPWLFVQRTWAYCFRTLLEVAQARGAVPTQFILAFTDTHDSSGTPWTDLGDYTIEPGGTLLDTLTGFAEKIGFEWRVTHDGSLLAALQLGADVSETVRFFEGISVFQAEQTEDRKDVATDVFLVGGDARIGVARDVTGRFGTREVWVSQSEVADDATRAIVADTVLRLSKDPEQVRTFKVRNDAPGARAFVNYRCGDIVGYGPRQADGTGDYAVKALAVKVGASGVVDLELALLGKPVLLEQRLERSLKAVLGGNYSTSTSSGGVSGTVNAAVNLAVGNLRFDDLTDVIITSVATGDQVRWNGSAWENFRPSPKITVSDTPPAGPHQVDDLWVEK